MSEEKKREVCSWCERFTDNHYYGYYISFSPTGVEEIDRILCSIAAAGKGYHHTEGWGEGGYVDLIQRAAQAAADKWKAAPQPAPTRAPFEQDTMSHEDAPAPASGEDEVERVRLIRKSMKWLIRLRDSNAHDGFLRDCAKVAANDLAKVLESLSLRPSASNATMEEQP